METNNIDGLEVFDASLVREDMLLARARHRYLGKAVVVGVLIFGALVWLAISTQVISVWGLILVAVFGMLPLVLVWRWSRALCLEYALLPHTYVPTHPHRVPLQWVAVDFSGRQLELDFALNEAITRSFAQGRRCVKVVLLGNLREGISIIEWHTKEGCVARMMVRGIEERTREDRQGYVYGFVYGPHQVWMRNVEVGRKIFSGLRALA